MSGTKLDFAYTPIPNWYFEEMSKILLSDNLVMLCVFRNTLGWQARGNTRRVMTSLTVVQICEMTKLSERSVLRSMNKLVEMGLVGRKIKQVRSNELSLMLPEKAVPIVESPTIPKDFAQEDLSLGIVGEGEENWEAAYTALSGLGIERVQAGKLVEMAQRNGRDSQFVEELVDYALQNNDITNPAGLVARLIQQNETRLSKRQLQKLKEAQRFAKFQQHETPSTHFDAVATAKDEAEEDVWLGLEEFFWIQGLEPVSYDGYDAVLEVDLKRPASGEEFYPEQAALLAGVQPYLPKVERVNLRYVTVQEEV